MALRRNSNQTGSAWVYPSLIRTNATWLWPPGSSTSSPAEWREARPFPEGGEDIMVQFRFRTSVKAGACAALIGLWLGPAPVAAAPMGALSASGRVAPEPIVELVQQRRVAPRRAGLAPFNVDAPAVMPRSPRRSGSAFSASPPRRRPPISRAASIRPSILSTHGVARSTVRPTATDRVANTTKDPSTLGAGPSRCEKTLAVSTAAIALGTGADPGTAAAQREAARQAAWEREQRRVWREQQRYARPTPQPGYGYGGGWAQPRLLQPSSPVLQPQPEARRTADRQLSRRPGRTSRGVSLQPSAKRSSAP